MWCTRWFLPLLLLPLPTASPYFLFLFFFSLTLHARPCFYCIILLTALFTSSCYWQPVPTRALFQTAFPKISSSMPLLYHPNVSVTDKQAMSPSQLAPVPNLARLVDRCWCDLSGGHLFDPYNITQWQLTSLSRALGASESQRVLVAQELDVTSSKGGMVKGDAMGRVWVLTMTEKVTPTAENEEAVSNTTFGGWLLPSFPSLLNLTIPFSFGFGRDISSVTDSSPPADPMLDVKQHLLRQKYDLRPHGIDLLVDFGWGRSY